MLGAELQAAAEALPEGGPPVLARLAAVRLSPRRAALFRRRLVRLVEDFLAMEKPAGENTTLCLAYYRQQDAPGEDPAPSGARKG
jgi:hypothetical protein